AVETVLYGWPASGTSRIAASGDPMVESPSAQLLLVSLESRHTTPTTRSACAEVLAEFHAWSWFASAPRSTCHVVPLMHSLPAVDRLRPFGPVSSMLERAV